MIHVVRATAGVRVSTTSGNLGPGFNCLRLTHNVWDKIRVWLATGSARVHTLGEGRGALPTDDSHLIVRAIRRGFDAVGPPQVGIEFNCRNGIAQGRGLKSSTTAIVTGLMLMQGLVDKPELLDDDTILRLAAEFERHFDNAAPALHGRTVFSRMTDEGPKAVEINVTKGIKATLLVPEVELTTEVARSVLPSDVLHGDTTFNASRAAMLVLALQGRLGLLLEATGNRLHQRHRTDSIPESVEVLRALRGTEWPTVVSGAGPSVLVFNKLDRRTWDLFAVRGFRPTIVEISSGAHLIRGSR